MKKRNLAVVVGLMLVTLLFVGCNLFSAISGAKQAVRQAQEVAPTVLAVATQQSGKVSPSPTFAPTTSAANGDAEEFDPDSWVAPSQIKDFRSYRSHILLVAEFPKSGKKVTLFELKGEASLTDKGERASHIVLSEGGKLGFEMIKIGDRLWASSDGKNWTVAPTEQQMEDELLPEAQFESLTADPAAWKKVGTAKVNGLPTEHYVMRVSNADQAGDFLGMAQSLGLKSLKVNSITSEVYLYQGKVPIKGGYVLECTGANDKGSFPVNIRYTYEISDINDPAIKIAPPQGASAAAQAPFPLPPNAKFELAAGGLQSFTVPNATVSDVMEFFEKNLPPAGFTISNKQGSDSTGWMFTVSGKGASYHVIVAPADDGAEITVQK